MGSNEAFGRSFSSKTCFYVNGNQEKKVCAWNPATLLPLRPAFSKSWWQGTVHFLLLLLQPDPSAVVTSTLILPFNVLKFSFLCSHSHWTLKRRYIYIYNDKRERISWLLWASDILLVKSTFTLTLTGLPVVALSSADLLDKWWKHLT